MGPRYLLDTNTVIDFSAQKLPANAYQLLSSIIDTLPQISIINKIELLSFTHLPEQITVFTDTAVIAATALVHGLILITRNTADFKAVNGLELLNPWQEQ